MGATEHPEIQKMSLEERFIAQKNTAMTDPKKLLAWLEESGRTWLVFNARHLVESLRFDDLEMMQAIIANYRDYRATQKQDGQPHGETLEVYELDRAIRFLISQITAKDPNWSLEAVSK